MNWLERAAREISKTTGQPTAETAKTPVSSVLAVTQERISQESGGAAADRLLSEGDGPNFAARLPSRRCATCMHFRATPGQTPDGHCTRFKVATWGVYAHGCPNGWAPQEPAHRDPLRPSRQCH